jgi:glutamate/tyrosine decarboxylase-like PLP-dependent enzyme
LAYVAGDDVLAIAEEAYRRFAVENALNTDAFPSLRAMQHDVVEIAAGWLGGGTGFMTAGGTESLLLVVKAARDRARAERGITAPNAVLPASAHAALEKGCAYFGVTSRRIPVGADWRADPAAMEAAVDADTVLVVGSAPQYPQGVIDPIPAIAALAAARDINCHVDACMGGIALPYLARLGQVVPPWNFAVEGVTSISVDLHKFGYTAKGAGVLLHRDKRLRDHQTFVTDNWLGGTYGSSGVLGTKSGGAIAAAWAVLQYLGDDGYLELTRRARRATEQLAAVIDDHPALTLRAAPETMLVAFGAADPGNPRRVRRRRRTAPHRRLVRRPPGSPSIAALHRERDPRRPHRRARRRPAGRGRGRPRRGPRRHAGRLRHRRLRSQAPSCRSGIASRL